MMMILMLQPVHWCLLLLLFFFWTSIYSCHCVCRMSWKSIHLTSLASLPISTLILLKIISLTRLLPSKSTPPLQQLFSVRPMPKISRNLRHTVLTEVLQEEFVLKLSRIEVQKLIAFLTLHLQNDFEWGQNWNYFQFLQTCEPTQLIGNYYDTILIK